MNRSYTPAPRSPWWKPLIWFGCLLSWPLLGIPRWVASWRTQAGAAPSRTSWLERKPPLEPQPCGRLRGRYLRGSRERVANLLTLAMLVSIVALGFAGWTSCRREHATTGATEALPAPRGANSPATPLRPEPSDFVGDPDKAIRTTTGGEVEWSGFTITEYAHEKEPWIADLMAETLASPGHRNPFVAIVPDDSTGKFINVTDHRRESYQPAEPELRVWYFGGSTTYGIGQRDKQTIPSVIAALAEADGIAIRSENFGVSNDVNWQGTERFAQAITSDMPKPDLVVFYDGINDQGLAFQRQQAGDVAFGRIRLAPAGDIDRKKFLEDTQTVALQPAETAEVEIEHASTQYWRGVELARSIGSAWDVEVRHFWQPSLQTKRLSPADLPLLDRLGLEQETVARYTAQSKLVLDRSGAPAVDVSDLFDDAEVPIYFDWGHTNEYGAWLVAEELYEHLRPDFERLARESTEEP